LDKNIFIDKNTIPTIIDLADGLGNTYDLWQMIVDYAHSKYPKAIDEWHYPGEKYGWSFRVKDKKRAILYLLPKDRFFKVAFVFGQKATDAVNRSLVSAEIKNELAAAKVYAEGRGIRIEIRNELLVTDIKVLIDIKLAN
jgi:hypothetical protein